MYDLPGFWQAVVMMGLVALTLRSLWRMNLALRLHKSGDGGWATARVNSRLMFAFWALVWGICGVTLVGWQWTFALGTLLSVGIPAAVCLDLGHGGIEWDITRVADSFGESRTDAAAKIRKVIADAGVPWKRAVTELVDSAPPTV